MTRKEVEEFKRLTAQRVTEEEVDAETAPTIKVAGEVAELRAEARLLRKKEGRLQAALNRVQSRLETVQNRLSELTKS